MDKPYDFGERSFRFGVAIVAFCRLVARCDPILRRLAHQLVDSGTSIGVNLSEGVSGQSKADFISKQSIALKESRETRFGSASLQQANRRWRHRPLRSCRKRTNSCPC